jgi:inner membrane protein
MPGTPTTPAHLGDRTALGAWIALFVLTLFTHPLLDLFTSYGTQLLAPFSNRRFALDAIAVIDPVYSAMLLVALTLGLFTGPARRPTWRLDWSRAAAVLALVLSTAYLFYGLWLNQQAEREAYAQLAAQGRPAARVHCYPTLLQLYLRRCVARAEGEVWVGALSLWRSHPVDWRAFKPPNHPLVDQLLQTREGRIFEWFAMGQVAPQVLRQDGRFVVTLDDLRYGFFIDPAHGLWGIRAEFDERRGLLRGPQRFDRPLPADIATLLTRLWTATFAPS